MQQCGQTVHVAATVLKGLSTAESKCSDFITKVDVSFMVILMKVDQSGRHQWAHIFPKRKCYLCYAKDGAVSVTVFQARKIRRGRKRFLALQKCLQYCKLEAQQSTIGQHALSFLHISLLLSSLVNVTKSTTGTSRSWFAGIRTLAKLCKGLLLGRCFGSTLFGISGRKLRERERERERKKEVPFCQL